VTIDGLSIDKSGVQHKNCIKKTCICIVAEKIYQVHNCLIKTLVSKLLKVRDVLTSIQSKVEDVDLEYDDVQPQ
jgi:hypothetical protein